MQHQTANDTICAIATPSGGALSVIRISGPEAISIVQTVFRPISGRALAEQPPYSVCLGHLLDDNGEILDETLATVFRAPHSYTGEESVELSCHGSQFISQQAVALLIMHGCRQAGPGEFTQRAFMAGKMDLSQAEAVADLISSTSAASHRLAINQMKGGFSRKLDELRSQLINLTSLLELELDFSEEDVQFADREQLRLIAEDIEATLSRLAASFKSGEAIRKGVPVAIIGRTNTGKSTLLNLLLNDDRALVSSIQGTTRDSIEDTSVIGGILFRFIDTAGIRQSDDTVERMGIERSFQIAEKADIILLVTDCSQPETENDTELDNMLKPIIQSKTLIRVHNKADLTRTVPEGDKVNIYISAKQEINIDTLKLMLTKAAPIPPNDTDTVTVTNIRHYQAILRALDCIKRALTGLSDGTPADLLSQDTRECIHHLSDILGEVTTDQVLSTIFSRFCIGK